MHEAGAACKRTECNRYGYLSGLPPREYLPMFWRLDELDLLQGTEVAQNVLVHDMSLKSSSWTPFY